MERFAGIGCGLSDVTAIALCHCCEVLERAHLLGKLFAQADDVVRRPHVVDLRTLLALDLTEAIGAVKRHAAVVADDAASAIGVRKAGDDAGPAAIHDLRRVGVEYAVIVRFAVLGEGLMDLGIGLEPRGFQARFHHAQAAVWKDRPLERLVRLQADDDFVVAIDVSGLVRQQGRRILLIDGEHPLLSLLGEIGLQLCPNGLGAL